MKSLSNKITIGVAIITTVLLILVSFFTVTKMRDDFNVFVEQRRPYMVREIFAPKVPQAALVLEENFVKSLYSTVFKANIVAIILALLFGVMVGRMVRSPLNTIKKGIHKLKEEDYKFKIIADVDEEFQEVVDELNLLVSKLEKSEKLRAELISDISHELKTPITAILGQMEGVKDGVLDMDSKRVETVIEQVRRLDLMVDELRDYIKTKDKTTRLNIAKIDFEKRMSKIIESYKEKLTDKNIRIETKISEKYLSADGEMMVRLFSNLIDNAIKYSECKTIKISYEDQKIVFEDDGKGVDKENIDNLFERFYRVDKSRNKSKGGLGLGLAIVKDIIDAHGWTVEISSEKGLRFEIET